MVNYLDPGASGLAFGRVGQRYIVLSRGMLALFDRNRSALRAIVLHELAHLRNRDVDIAFITIVLSRVYLALIVLPSVVVFALALPPPAGVPGYVVVFAAVMVWYLVFLAVLIPLARNAVLRSRELHADARAALWDGAPDGLGRLFRQQRSRQRRWLNRLLAVHPVPSDRLTALTDTRNLLALGFGEAVTMGLAIGLALDLPIQLGYGSLMITYTFFATLLALGVGFGVWRDAISQYVTRGPSKVDMPGLGLGIGLAGGIVSPMQVAVLGLNDSLRASYVASVVLPWFAMLVVGSWLCVRWMAAATRAWLPVAGAVRSPAIVVTASLAASAALLITWLNYVLPLALQAGILQADALPGWPRAVAFLATTVILTAAKPPVLVIAILLGLAVYPLIGVFLARRLRTTPRISWLTLDAVPIERCTQARSRAQFTVTKVGIITALSALALILICYLSSGLAAPEILADAIGAHLTPALVMATEVAAAIIATVKAPDLRVLYGIIEAFIAGIVVIVGEHIAVRLTVCAIAVNYGEPCGFATRLPSPNLSVMLYDLTWGLELAFLAALLTAAVTRKRPEHNPVTAR